MACTIKEPPTKAAKMTGRTNDGVYGYKLTPGIGLDDILEWIVVSDYVSGWSTLVASILDVGEKPGPVGALI